MFGTDIQTFFGPQTASNSSKWDNSWEVTGRELINILMGGTGGINAKSYPGGLPEVVRENLKRNAPRAVLESITIPLAFRIGRKVLAKPRNAMNRQLKTVGLGMVKV